jgi:hypothetical protein
MMIPIIKDKILDDKCVEEDVLFTHLISLINDILIVAKPDLYYDARPK